MLVMTTAANFENLGIVLVFLGVLNLLAVIIYDAILINWAQSPIPNLKEISIMFVVKDDHAPVPFSLALGEVKDAEGPCLRKDGDCESWIATVKIGPAPE